MTWEEKVQALENNPTRTQVAYGSVDPHPLVRLAAVMNEKATVNQLRYATKDRSELVREVAKIQLKRRVKWYRRLFLLLFL